MTDNQLITPISNQPKRVVFCDFDGTITVEETFVAMLKHFAPDLSAQLIPEMYAKKLTLRAGVRQILESIPAECYPEIIKFSQDKLIRPGLVELLDFLDSQGIPFVVVSGGIRVMVETVMGDLVNRVEAIYALDLDASGSHLKVLSEFEGETELVSKVRVMELYDADVRVAIGDSVTDLNMAKAASIVFARDRLVKYLDEEQKSYILWNDFFDVINNLTVNK
ncbi:2-hydroxy-3-keto-5-methylthiopentenyl-1-phosphate phosphatase [Oscillatoriales cyanobacterium USR001]|nr:2-hydroxy-3-keto-5-methylthiopentenyl-1-phosphate phosphatase [Oscillatoriales cyanobacterium USR001]